MEKYVRILRQLVRESRYVLNECAVAEAILNRARLRMTRDCMELRSPVPGAELLLNVTVPSQDRLDRSDERQSPIADRAE